jgi:hypothetical protein
MPSVVPDVDKYGTYARVSAVSDLLEWQALAEPSMTVAELADYIRDSHWTGRLLERFRTPEDLAPAATEEDVPDSDNERLSGQIDRSTDAAGRVFDVLRQRSTILGDRYPFAIEKGRLNFAGRSSQVDQYLSLLSATLVHAYSLPSTVTPHRFFEDVVTDALVERGFLAANLGALARGASNFDTALIAAGKVCRIAPTPEAATIRVSAQEEGGDVIGHLYWHDPRPMHWSVVIQATCAESGDWVKKMYEHGLGLWKDALGVLYRPQMGLAVPHHVEDRGIRYLLRHGAGERFLLDRLRLCLPGLLARQEVGPLIDAVMAHPVELGR